MTLRMRYYCPENFENSVRFDIKVVDPSGNLVIVPGKGTTQGFTTYFVLETIPGGGIFTVAIGDDNPGFFVSGKYSIGLWNGGINYYSTVIELL